nr:hypothetical protein [uncultured Mediterranean phage uvMED]
MATHDYNIANQTGADFRADLNNALLAIVSNNSNATSPSTTYAYQLWVDTANNVLKLRNSANSDWITTGISITASNSFTGDITGNSATATALATARTINGVSFDGTANISFNTDSVSEGSSNLYFTNERVDDQVNSLLTAGSGISLTYDDSAGTLTIANTNSADITSVVAGDGLTGGGTSGDVTLTVSVDDSSIEINSDSLRVKASGITNAMLGGSIANSKLANSSVTINSQAISLGGSHTFDSDDIGEGSSNLYFTNARARGSLSIGSEGSASGNGAIAYNSSTGVFTYTPPVISGLTGDTDDLSEGSSNLYYTDARANSAIDARVTNTFINNLSGVVADTATALATARSISLSGDVTASGVNFDGTGDITLSTTIAANSVALGTDTTGNYVATVAGTSNEIEVSGSGSETASITIGLPDDVTIAGNLTVNGTTTTVNSDTLSVTDPLIKLAKANSGADSLDIGFYGLYDTSGSQDLYAGLFRDASDSGKFKLFKDLQAEPTTTVNTSGTGYAVGTLVSNLEGAVTGNAATATGLETARAIALSGDVVGTANFDGTAGISISTTIQPNSVALSTDTTGDYVSTITAGTGLTSTGATSGEGVAHSLSVDAAQTQITSVGTLSSLNVGSAIYVDNTASSSFGAIELSGTSGAFIDLKTPSSDDFDIRVQTTGSGGVIDTGSGEVTIKRQGSTKLATTSSGVDVTGTLTATTLAGTLSTAAQTNITSVGTLTSFRSTGIDDNADALAITIDSSENVAIGRTTASARLHVQAPADTSTISTSSTPAARINNGGAISLWIGSNNYNYGYVQSIQDDGSNNLKPLSLQPLGDNVGIGTTSPAATLDVTSSASDAVFLRSSESTTTNVYITNTNATANNTANLYFAPANNVSGALISTIAIEDFSSSANRTADLAFSTRKDGTMAERMRILSGGNVGIGTTSPSHKLQVNDNSAGNTTYAIVSDNNGASGTTVAGLGFANGGSLKSSITAAVFGNDFMTFNVGGSGTTERMRIDSSGNVGIGTTSPAKTLEVNAGTNTEMRIGTTTNGSLQLGHFGNGTFIGTDSGTPSAADLVRLGTGGVERMRIDASGNVGIGTSSPSQKLDVDTGHIAVDAGYGLVWSGDADRIITPEDNSVGGLFKVASAAATRFMRGSSESMRIDASGNVGIGTSNPSFGSGSGLEIERAGIATIRLQNSNSKSVEITQDSDFTIASKNSSSNIILMPTSSVGIGTSSPSKSLHILNADPVIRLEDSSPSAYAEIDGAGGDLIISCDAGNDDADSVIQFKVDNSEKMRIDSSGNLLVGTTNTSAGVGNTDQGHVISGNNNYASHSRNGNVPLFLNRNTSHGDILSFRYIGNEVGSVSVTNTATSYNTSSDARLKDVTGSARGLEVINELNPVAYNWKADNHADEGLIAQEVEQLVPNAVNQDEDGYYSMDYSKLVTHLVKAVQEQQEQIESLKSEIANLKEN